MPLVVADRGGSRPGARVEGFSAADVRSSSAVGDFVTAVLEHGLLMLRGQSLAVMSALAETFGELEVVLPAEHRHPGSKGLRLQSNVPGVGVNGGGHYWHADGSWLPRSMDLTLLVCLEAPAEGGTTSFVDAAAVYEHFDDEFQKFVDGLVGTFPNRAVLEADLQAMGLKSPEMLDRAEDMTHPVVRLHPYTGRRAVIINEVWMRGIGGMNDDEATRVLSDLTDRVERSSFRYVHRWAVGDLLIWDNHRVLHKAASVPVETVKKTVRARILRLASRWLR